ncbi:MAG: putative TetR family transcriptional regulator [Ilumatobacteraceae bacterium]|nr:putative TetR family transcriptional regulator [Ilumatobacteraceae bacterium]
MHATPINGETSPPKRSVGRPRRHDADVERELIFDAAYAAVRDSSDGQVAVSDILASAGISTRSFYRHFQSKDQLLCAMYRRDAVRASARLTDKVQQSASAREAVGTWIEEILGFRRVRPKAERVTVLGSIVANRAEGSQAVARESRAMLLAPLQAAIARGIDDGTYATLDAASSAAMVAAVVFDVAGLGAFAAHPASERIAADTVQQFCFRALGADAAR